MASRVRILRQGLVLFGVVIALVVLPTPGIADSAGAVDWPTYQRVEGVAGTLNSVGSDTLANLMALWAEAFKRVYPALTIQIQAAGSSTAPPALIQQTANVGPMSRPLRAGEAAAFYDRFGYEPTSVIVGIDAVAIYVHRDNPIDALSLPELDAIFSATRRCGHAVAIRRWDQLGIGGELAGARIQLYGRNSVSGTYGFFKQHALCRGDYRNEVNEQPGSASVVQGVARSLNGIGYSGIGYRTAEVRPVPLIPRGGQTAVPPEPDPVRRDRYPLSHPLYIIINNPPTRPLKPLVAEFLRFVLSQRGQAAVTQEGFIPLPADVLSEQRSRLE